MATPFLYNGQWGIQAFRHSGIQAFRHSGIQADSNGLLNMRARYHSPYLMRFLNADPIGFSGGLEITGDRNNQFFACCVV